MAHNKGCMSKYWGADFVESFFLLHIINLSLKSIILATPDEPDQ